MAEKPNKKVSRACNTCRLKRKKCNGLDPCLFCTETNLECSYSREPRRRGPPSGYLRNTETRANLLETLIGLLIVNLTTTNIAGALLESVKTLRTESTTRTQDVWDVYKLNWTSSEAAKILDELAMSFAPFVHRTDQENFSKPLLPSFNSGVNSNRSPSIKHGSPSSTTSLALEQPNWPSQSETSSTPAVPTSPVDRVLPLYPSFMLPRESFERTQSSTSVSSPRSLDIPAQKSPPTNPKAEQRWHSTILQEEIREFSPSFAFPGSEYGDSAEEVYSLPAQASIHHTTRRLVDRDIPMVDVEGRRTDIMLPQNLLVPSGYGGSYWRTADTENFSSASGLTSHFMSTPPSLEVDLPPPHIVSYLLDIYFQHVHSSFPFLGSRSSLSALLPGSETPFPSEGTTCLLLALCAYCGRLSPSMDYSNNSGFGFGKAGDAGKVAADLWYEQARMVMNASLRKGSKLETMQTLLLLTLRDYGKGNAGQAWLLSGLAVRMGQDLGLHDDPSRSSPAQAKYTLEERRIRRNVWGVALILDLFLSLQLGRPPAVADSLRVPMPSSHRNDSDSSLSFSIPGEPQPVFPHMVSLCQIVSRINLYFYLGFGRPDAASQSNKHTALQGELDQWHHALPVQFRISVGHQPEKEVLEVNMLYHVAVILLYRPLLSTADHLVSISAKNDNMHHAAETFIDAASTFSTLLEKYRTEPQTQSSHPMGSSLAHSSPNIIYLIFTVAIAHLSGFKFRQLLHESQHESTSRATTMALQTQLHLLNCLESLESIGQTWELARRCCRMLDHLMTGIKPKPVSAITVPAMAKGGANTGELRKRKREEEDRKPSGGEDMRVDDSGNGEHRRRDQDLDTNSSAGQLLDFAPSPPHPVPLSFSPQSAAAGGLPAEGLQPFSSQQTLNSTPLDWSMNPDNPSLGSSALNRTPIVAENFESTLFSFSRWLPEVPEGEASVQAGWEGNWEAGSWVRGGGAEF